MKSSMNSEFCSLGDFKQPLEQPHQFIQIFYLFYTKKPTFSILHIHFYKTPTLVYLFYIYLFNKIFIILQFFIIHSLTTPLSHRPTVHYYQRSLHTQPPSPPLSPPNQRHQEKPTHSI